MINHVLQLQEEILSAHIVMEEVYKALLKTPWNKHLIVELAAACQARQALWDELRTVMDGLLDHQHPNGPRESAFAADVSRVLDTRQEAA